MENFLDIDLDQAAQPAQSRQPGQPNPGSVERPLSQTEYQHHNRTQSRAIDQSQAIDQSRAIDRSGTPEASSQKLQVKVEQTSETEHPELEPNKPSDHSRQGMLEPLDGWEELSSQSRENEIDQRRDTTEEERYCRAEQILRAMIYYQENQDYPHIRLWTEEYRKLTGIKGLFKPEEELQKLHDRRGDRLTQAKQQSKFKRLMEVKTEDLQFDEPDFTTQLGKPLYYILVFNQLSMV